MEYKNKAGIIIPEGIKVYKGEIPGPTVALLKKTHGDELGGELVVDAVMKAVSSLKKGILYVGVGNLQASQKNVRFIDTDFNRSFGKFSPKGYEGKRALEFKPILSCVDYLLDIHSFRKPAPPIICYPGDDFSKLEKITAHLPIKTIVYGPGLWPPNGDHIYADTYVCANDGFGFTIESGYLDDSTAVKSIATGVYGILETLLGVAGERISVEVPNITKEYWYAYENVVAEPGFSFSKELENFEFIPKGKVFAIANNKKYVAKVDSYALFPKAQDSVVEGSEVCILLTKI